jgi:hypothetical protein
MSGLLETVASPLVITPAANEGVLDEAAGDVTKTGGRLPAATEMATTSAHSDAVAAETRTTRIDECMLGNLLAMPTTRFAGR